MTALRVVTDHEELENVGAYRHAQIDTYLGQTNFIILSGSNPHPPQSKHLTAGAGIAINAVGENVYITSTGGAVPGQISWNEVPMGDVDGINKTFTLAYDTYSATSMQVYVNGIKQSYGIDSDFLTNNRDIIFNAGFTYEPGSSIEVTYQTAGVPTTTVAWNEVPSGANDGVNKVFTIAHSPTSDAAVMVYVNGIKMRNGASYDYTISGTTITFNADFTYAADSSIEVTYPY